MLRRITAALAVLALALSAAALGEETLGGIASDADKIAYDEVVDPDWTPVAADALNDGTYAVAVDCSSSMFAIVGCDLTVADGRMTARLQMKSDSYSYLFPGTPEEAAATPISQLIPLDASDGMFRFEFPVSALDAPVDCASYSARKEQWYPRVLAFRSDSLPLGAWKTEALTTAESLGLADGAYLCEVALEGKGKASVQSPAVLTVRDGQAWVDIVFSTKKIDYVIVDGEKYEPTSTEDGAAFTVPAAVFDSLIAITVDSTAITPATEVPYSLRLSSQSLKPVQP